MSFTSGQNFVQGDLLNTGKLEIGPGAALFVYGEYIGPIPTFVLPNTPPVLSNTFRILDLSSMTIVGTSNLQLRLNNGDAIGTPGDLGIGGAIILTYSSDLLADLAAHGPTQKYKIIDFGGGAFQTKVGTDGIAIPDQTKPIPDCTGVSICFVPGLGVSGPSLAALLGPTFNNFFPVAQRIGQEIDIAFLNPFSTGAMGPDFNGDGVVDGLDYLIWKMNNGIPSGATVLQGDANGDGKVDGADFLFWQRNAGHPGPWSGAGSSLADNVPEPASLAMLLSGISLVLACGKRRR